MAPKTTTKPSRIALATHQLAKRVGGKQGRSIAAAVSEALTRPSTGSRTLVGSQTASVLSFLGGYTPDSVPFTVKKRMRKHPQVRYCLAAAKAPILRGDIWFETNSTELAALTNRVFIESGYVRRMIRTSLLGIDFGFSAHEQIWDIDPTFDVGWDVPNAEGGTDHREKTYTNLFRPDRLKELDPALVTILTNKFGDKQGLLFGGNGRALLMEEDVRRALMSGEYNILDNRKSFIYTVDGEFQQHAGCARLDSAYDPWFWQGIIHLICNRWFERKSDPPLIGYAPSVAAMSDPGVTGTEYDPDDENEAPVLLMSRAMAKLRSTGDIALPSDPYFDEQGKPSNIKAYSIQELETKDVHPAFMEYIEHLDRKISRGLLVPDSITSSQKGMSQYGSLQVMADVYVDVQNDTLYSIVEQFQREIVQPFLDYNGIKDRVVARTGGISAANREAAKEMFVKVLEADMLAEQAFGRIFPQSLTAMVDREQLARANGVPFKRPDPDAPAPKPPQHVAEEGAAPGASGQPPRGPAKKTAAKPK